MNIQKLIKAAKQFEGKSFKKVLTIEEFQALTESAASKSGLKIESVFGKLCKLKNPTVEVAAKSSNQGFIIGQAVVRDGEKAVGKYSVSLSGLGTEQVVFKEKTAIGELYNQRGYVDMSKPIRFKNYEIHSSACGGIGKFDMSIDEAVGMHAEYNAEKLPSALKGIVSEADKSADKTIQLVKDLLAGKDVEVPAGAKRILNLIKSGSSKKLVDTVKPQFKSIEEALTSSCYIGQTEKNLTSFLETLVKTKQTTKLDMKTLEMIAEQGKANPQIRARILDGLENYSKNINFGAIDKDALKKIDDPVLVSRIEKIITSKAASLDDYHSSLIGILTSPALNEERIKYVLSDIKKIENVAQEHNVKLSKKVPDYLTEFIEKNY